MEKEQPDSMATVAIKPEYPPSEYSGSEPPPAYRRPMSSAVQIARIVGFTIVVSSFILGAFILASCYVSARAGCQQLDQLDAMLDKELALEARAYGNDALLPDEPLPVGGAHALHGAPPPAPTQGAKPAPVASAHTADDALNQAESKVNEDKLQKLDDDKDGKEETSDGSDESDGSDSEEDELTGIRGPGMRMPIQFDLDDLAGAFLANNNQKGRMNCVVERRREEIVEKRFPFNILGAFGARPEPSERIAIICHGDDKPAFPEPAAQVFAFPLSGPPRLPLRPLPAALQPPAPAPAQPQPPHRAAPFPMPMPWDSSEEINSQPREVRIHVQRVIAIPAPHNMPPPPENNMLFPRSQDMFPRDMPRDFPRPQENMMSRDFPRPQENMMPRDFPRPQENMMPRDFPRPQENMLPRDFPRPQESMFARDMPRDFARPQEGMFSRDMPRDMPFPRPQEGLFPREDMPFQRPQEQAMPMMPFQRPQEHMMPFQRPQETVIAFPRHQQENPMFQQQQPQGDQNEQPSVMQQFVPQPQQSGQEMEQPEIEMESNGMAELPWGLTPETLRAIHRHAVESEQQQGEGDVDQSQIDNDMQEVKTIVNTLAAAAAAEEQQAPALETGSAAEGAEGQAEAAPEAPVRLDAPALIQHEGPPEERPHYVQPRSVRSVDALLHREKRVKRCSCDCA